MRNRLDNSSENRKIFLDVLPRKEYRGRKCIDWENSVGFKIKFVCDNVEGYMTVLKYIKKEQDLIMQYNSKEFKIKTSQLTKCRIYKIIVEDLTGMKIGRLLIKHKDELGSSKNKSKWVCDCDCGNKDIIVTKSFIRRSKYVSCGCWRKEVQFLNQSKDISNQKFGYLTAIRIIGKTKSNNNIWECVCDCGNTSNVSGTALRCGETVSCGCYSRYKDKDLKPINHKRRLTNIYQSMKNRCYNEKHQQYKYYGGKGIKISKEWNTFDKFYQDVFDSYVIHVEEYGEDETSIDRIDSNKGYSRENYRWATNVEQSNNKSDTLIIEYNNQKKPLTEWCIELGLKRNLVYNRMSKGWDFEKAINTPKKIYNKKNY